MDQETIRKLAVELAQQMPNYPFWFLAIQTILILIAGAAAVYLGEYFKTRGMHLATKADFDDLQEQLRANTQLVETIKTEVGQRDWANREWINQRRIKLEELITKMHDCTEYLEQYRNFAIQGKLFIGRDPRPEFQTIADLYFPELTQSVHEFGNAFFKNRRSTFDLQYALAQIDASNNTAYQQVMDAYKAAFDETYPKLLQSQKELITAAAVLLRQIMGVANQCSA
jgi:hypothetical protein